MRRSEDEEPDEVNLWLEKPSSVTSIERWVLNSEPCLLLQKMASKGTDEQESLRKRSRHVSDVDSKAVRSLYSPALVPLECSSLLATPTHGKRMFRAAGPLPVESGEGTPGPKI